jgi:hypothetical protein
MPANAVAASKRRMPQSPIPSSAVQAGTCHLPQPPPNMSRQLPSPQQQHPQQPQSNVGLTLPQVVALVDRRLTTLEVFMREQQQQPQQREVVAAEGISKELEAVLDEFQSRFEILAEELSSLKNIVLSLQSYTMDVNKRLLEERFLPDDVNEEAIEPPQDDVEQEEETSAVASVY